MTSCDKNNRIIKVGNCSTGTSEGGVVLDPNGIFSTVTAGVHGYGMSNIIINDRGSVSKSPQVSTDGICMTLRAETYGNLPKVVEIGEEDG